MKSFPHSLRIAFTGLLLWIGSSGNLLALQDLDGDGKPDAVALDAGATWRGLTSYTLRFTLSSRIPAEAIEFELATSRPCLQLRDVDGDRDDDLVLRDEFNRAIAVFLNQGDGNFSLSTEPGLYDLNTSNSEHSSLIPPMRPRDVSRAGTTVPALLPTIGRSGLTADNPVAPVFEWPRRNARAGLPISRAPPKDLR